MTETCRVYEAETDDQKNQAYRLRYEIYVEEMNRYRGSAGHAARVLVEPEDAQSRLFVAEVAGAEGPEIVATMRLTWGGDAPLPERHIVQYDLARFLDEMPAEHLIVGERFMVAPAHRGGDVLWALFRHYMEFVNQHRIQLAFGDCEPHYLNLYMGMGFRTYTRRHVNSPETGYLIPLVMVAEDLDHLRRLKSPLSDVLADFGDDARVPGIVQDLVDQGGGVLAERLAGRGAYWQEVYQNIVALEQNRPTLFEGLTDEQAQACLAKSTMIECQPGDRVIKKGNVAKNLFVLLEGVLEVRDGANTIAFLEPGDVFGEIAFLIGRPRTMDVIAAGAGVKVISLSDSVIRKMIDDEPEIAAKLLLNISRMLCTRLVKES